MTVRHDLDTVAALATRLRPATLAALRTIDALERDYDGFPTRGDSTGTRSRATSSPVERIALADGPSSIALAADRQRITAGVANLVAALEHLHKLAGLYAPPTPDPRYARCIGGDSTPGALEWGDPTCTNIAEPNRNTGLCLACRNRRDRWLRKTRT